MRIKLLLAAAAAAIIGGQAAKADPLLSYELVDNGTVVSSGSNSSGNMTLAIADGGIQFNGTVYGVPLLASPDLSTTSNAVTGTFSTTRSYSGTHSLVLYITQSNLTTPTGVFGLDTTLDLNNKTGVSGVTSSAADYIDTADGVFTTSGSTVTKIASLTGITGADPNNGTNGQVTTVDAGSNVNGFSETEMIDVTFNAAGETLGSNNQITSVPEPASLALMGAAMLGIGMVRRRRKTLA